MIARTCLCRLYYAYLKLLERTVRLEFNLPDGIDGGIIAGFWHEDSFIMNLVLKRLAEDRDISLC